MRHRTLAAVLLPIGLLGCQAPLVRDTAPAREVNLERPLAVAEDTARVFIQSGKVLSHYSVNAFKAHCNFEVRELGNNGVEIEPDQFRITRVQRLEEQVVFLTPVRVATIGDGGPPFVKEGFHLWLQSVRQPEVIRLSCHGARDERGLARPPTTEEIDEALGSVARVLY